ncbi:MAG: hypothetical protein E6Q41_00470 [Cyclobacteriaceae bacterium]|nr:MAG: hypothetical protein E6Q41_00470 [Cyclobacteriaceae bacterium]
MSENHRPLHRAFLLGLIPSVVGLLIFFSWWAGKAWFLTNFPKLETIGLLWIPVATVIALIAIVYAGVYLLRAEKNILSVIKTLSAIAFIFLNIPVLLWVLDMQEHIDHRAYIRICNQTGLDFSDLSVENYLYTAQPGSLKNGKCETTYFYPNYNEAESGANPETVILTIFMSGHKTKIIMPRIYKGECREVIVNQDFKAELK